VLGFGLLTGARDGAIASFKLKHLDLDRNLLEQDAREVRTKASKSFPTFFFPVGTDVRAIIVEWVDYLRTDKAVRVRRSAVPGQHRPRGREPSVSVRRDRPEALVERRPDPDDLQGGGLPRAPAVNRLDAVPTAVGADSLPAWSGAKTMAWGIFHLAAPRLIAA
jgi:hypothetical protein